MRIGFLQYQGRQRRSSMVSKWRGNIVCSVSGARRVCQFFDLIGPKAKVDVVQEFEAFKDFQESTAMLSVEVREAQTTFDCRELRSPGRVSPSLHDDVANAFPIPRLKVAPAKANDLQIW